MRSAMRSGPRSGSTLALPGLWTLAMTGGAVSTRQLTALRISFRSAAASLMSGFLSAASTRSRKTLWSSKSASPSAFAQRRGDLDEAAVALPGLGVEQLLLLLLGQALLRCRRPSSLVALVRRRCPTRPGASPARRRLWRSRRRGRRRTRRRARRGCPRRRRRSAASRWPSA